MGILEFMSDSPFLTFFILVITYACIESVVEKICNRNKNSNGEK
jgi:hypothetical protein